MFCCLWLLLFVLVCFQICLYEVGEFDWFVLAQLCSIVFDWFRCVLFVSPWCLMICICCCCVLFVYWQLMLVFDCVCSLFAICGFCLCLLFMFILGCFCLCLNCVVCFCMPLYVFDCVHLGSIPNKQQKIHNFIFFWITWKGQPSR